MPTCQALLPCSVSPLAHRPSPSLAAVVSQQGDYAANPGTSATNLSVPAIVLGPLNPLLAALVEEPSTKL
jgi:hypothetical protein